MNTDRPLEDLLDELIQMSMPHRQRYLDEMRGDNPQLCAQLEKLLSATEQAGSFMQYDDDRSDLSVNEAQIGPYRIREQIGEGGMGVVYVAEQTEPVQRKVAIKIIKPGMDTKEVIARFEAERQALAFMEHPNIARVLDAGATESGRSYFVMELVRGIPITEYCDQVKATPRERLELFKTVCDAVQHAHQKGIIHRDIKPSNVLVTQVGADPVVKVIDFGLAKATSGQKLTEKTVYTGFMKLMGTPIYMSPEQAGLSGLDIDTRSDVYSLGILLYELLTGTTPLDKTEIRQKAYEELCRQIREVEALKPSARISTLTSAERSMIAQQRQIEPKSLRQLLNGDLDVVVLKALEKDRDRRYETPKELAADIDRFLADKPVQAVRPSPLYLARKYMRRHKAAILMATSILTLLVLATAVSTWQAIRATRFGNDAIEAKQEAVAAKNVADQAKSDAERTSEQRRRELYATNMKLADELWNSSYGRTREIEQLLAAWIPVDNSQEDLREFAWRNLWSRLNGEAFTVRDTNAATISPNGRLITADMDGIRQWNAATGESVELWNGNCHRAVLSPNGLRAAIPANDEFKLIDLNDRKSIGRIPGNRCTFAQNGKFLTTWQVATTYGPEGSQQEARVWKVDGEKPIQVGFIPIAQGMIAELEFADISLAPDGKSFAIRSTRGDYALRDAYVLRAFFDVPSSPITLTFPSPVNRGWCWSTDSQILVNGTASGHVIFRSAHRPERVLTLRSNGREVRSLAMSPDGSKLALGGAIGTIEIWDVTAVVNELSSECGENTESNAIVSDPSRNVDVRRTRSNLVSAVHGSMGKPKLLQTIKAQAGPRPSLVFSADGSKLVTQSGGVSQLWDLETIPGMYHLATVADRFSAHVGLDWEDTDDGVRVKAVPAKSDELVSGTVNVGDRIVGVYTDSSVKVTDATTLDAYEIDRLMLGPYESVLKLQFEDAADGKLKSVEMRRLFARSKRKNVNQRGRTPPWSHDFAFHPNGDFCAVASWNLGAISIDLRTQEIRRYKAFGRSVAISRNGLLAIMDERHVVLWDLVKDEPRGKLDVRAIERRQSGLGENFGGNLCFSPNGDYLVLASGGGAWRPELRSELKVWRVKDLEEIGSPLFENNYTLAALAFTPDGRQLIVGDYAGTVRVWNTDNWGEPVRSFHLGKRQRLTRLAISPDGRTLTVASYSGQLSTWDFQSGQKLSHFDRPVYAVAVSPDGRTRAAGFKGAEVILWDVFSGVQLRSVNVHTAPVLSVAFSPDGNTLASVGRNGMLHLSKTIPLNEIDRHSLTLQMLTRAGASANEDRRWDEAETILRHTLRLQRETLPAGNRAIPVTRAEIGAAMRGQRRLPIIDRQPRSHKVSKGDAAYFRVGITQEGPWEYQWFRNGNRILGATESIYHLPAVASTHFGRYHVEVVPAGDQDVPPTVSNFVYLIEKQNERFGHGLKWEVYSNCEDRTKAAKFPQQPDNVAVLNDFEIPAFQDDNYCGRLFGLVTPPVTGEYVFYVTSRYPSELYLSRDDLPDDMRKIASITQGTDRRDWSSNQRGVRSETIRLESGKRYWIKAVCQNGASDYPIEHLAVTWQLPGHPPPPRGAPPIQGEFLQHRLE